MVPLAGNWNFMTVHSLLPLQVRRGQGVQRDGARRCGGSVFVVAGGAGAVREGGGPVRPGPVLGHGQEGERQEEQRRRRAQEGQQEEERLLIRFDSEFFSLLPSSRNPMQCGPPGHASHLVFIWFGYKGLHLL